MTDPVLKTTHVTDGLKRLLWQFRDQPNIRAIVQSYLEEIQELEDVLYSLIVERYVQTAVGVQLDGIGRVVGEPRQNRTDTDYRVAVIGRIARNKAHSRIEDILALFLLLLPTHTFELIEGITAEFILRIVEALVPTTHPSPEVLAAQLHDAKGGGIHVTLIWSEYPESNTFTTADGSVLQADTLRGTADAPPSTIGGYLSGAL
jgi:hypothetical protein